MHHWSTKQPKAMLARAQGFMDTWILRHSTVFYQPSPTKTSTHVYDTLRWSFHDLKILRSELTNQSYFPKKLGGHSPHWSPVLSHPEHPNQQKCHRVDAWWPLLLTLPSTIPTRIGTLGHCYLSCAFPVPRLLPRPDLGFMTSSTAIRLHSPVFIFNLRVH